MVGRSHFYDTMDDSIIGGVALVALDLSPFRRFWWSVKIRSDLIKDRSNCARALPEPNPTHNHRFAPLMALAQISLMRFDAIN